MSSTHYRSENRVFFKEGVAWILRRVSDLNKDPRSMYEVTRNEIFINYGPLRGISAFASGFMLADGV